MLLVLAVALIKGSVGDYAKEAQGAGIVSLSQQNFQQFTTKPNRITFLQFYDPKGSASKKVEKTFITTATDLKGLADFALVDCKREAALCRSKDIDFKTLPIFQLYVGGEVKTFKGDPTTKPVSDFLQKELPNEVEALKKTNLKKFLKNFAQLPKAVFFTKTTPTPTLIKSFAIQLKGRMIVAEASNTDRKLVRQFKAESYPSLFVLPASLGASEDDDDDGLDPIVYSGKFLAPAVNAFLSNHAIPGEEEEEERAFTVDQLVDQSCLEHNCLRGGLCAVAIISADLTTPQGRRSRREALSVMEQLKAESKEKAYNYVWLDGIEQMEFLEAFYITPQDYPQLIVLSAKKLRFAPFVGSFSKESISSFLKDVHAGKIKTEPIGAKSLPKLKGDTTKCESEKPKPPPKPSSSSASSSSSAASGSVSRGYRGTASVVELKSENFDNYLLPSKAAWLVGFFDENTSAEVSSAWEKAAKASKHLVRFGRVDASKELAERFKVTTFPSIKVFAAGEKSEDAEDYTGELTEKALSEYALSLLAPAADVLSVFTDGKAFTQWWASAPLQPRFLLLSDKSEAPGLMKAMALEYQGELPFGVSLNADEALAKQFKSEGYPDLLLLQGVPGKKLPDGRTEVSIQSQRVPKSDLTVPKLLQHCDSLALQWRQALKKAQEAENGELKDDDLDDHDEL